MTKAEHVPLSEVLSMVSSELKAAHDAAVREGRAILILEECEIELSVETEKSAGGGVKFWVVNLDGSAKKKSAHKIKVKYKANTPIVAKAENAGEGKGPPVRNSEKPKETGGLAMSPPGRKIVRNSTFDPDYVRPPASDWIQQNWESLPNNSWVAADADGTVISAPSYDQLLEKIKPRQLTDFVVAFVERKVLKMPISFPAGWKAKPLLPPDYRAYAHVEVLSATGSPLAGFNCLVDTGSDFTLLPHSVTGLLGVIPSKSVTLRVASGAVLSLDTEPGVSLKIEGYKVTVDVAFYHGSGFSPIVGRHELLTAFDFAFDTSDWHWGP